MWYVCGGGVAAKPSVFIYDPDANTTTLVEAFEDKLLTTTEEYDENGELYSITDHYYISPKPMYDGTYLYIAEGGFYGSEYSDRDMTVHIFTLEGERLGGFVFQRKGACQINILDETFYIQTTEGTVYCSVADVIAGNIEWKQLYQFDQNK